MNREELDLKITKTFKEVCNDEGFLNKKTVEGKIGGTNYKKSDKYIDFLSLSQTTTLGVYGNQFEIVLVGSCSILEIENIWKDFKSLINPILEDKKYQLYSEKSISKTYSVGYNKEKMKDKFPNNIKDTGWLNFEISEIGIEQFRKVIKYIIQEELLPELDKYRSLEGLDKQLNSTIELGDLENYNVNENGIIFRRIIIAKLVDNPLFEEICNKERSFFNDYIEASSERGYEYFRNIPIVFEKIYEKLKHIS